MQPQVRKMAQEFLIHSSHSLSYTSETRDKHMLYSKFFRIFSKKGLLTSHCAFLQIWGSSNEVETWENNDCFILCRCQHYLLSLPTAECCSCPASHKCSRQIKKCCFPTCFGWQKKVVTVDMQQ